MAKHREKDQIEDNLDREARKLGWTVASFRIYGNRLYYLRDSSGELMFDGQSLDSGEVLAALENEKAAVAAVACLKGRN